MPENRKYFSHNSVVLVTSRTEEGLPLVASLLLNFFIWGILARARQLYQVRICHFLFMFNHFHLLLVVDNPEHVSEFVGYVKGEIAHVINRLLGRRQKTIWKDGYDSPVILTVNDVLRYIRYIYLNPVRAHLVEKVADYPGVSSWEMFMKDISVRKCKKLSRPSVPTLLSSKLSMKEQAEILASLNDLKGRDCEFVLEPFAWMDCFAGYSNVSREEIKNQLIADIEREERELLEKRKVKDIKVVGESTLRCQCMKKEYVPMKHGRKMICISSDKELRSTFIDFFRGLCDKAKKVYRKWKCADFSCKIPPGLFAPRVPTLCSSICMII